MLESSRIFNLGFTPVEYGPLLDRYFDAFGAYIHGRTYIQRMYDRWASNSQRDAFYNATLGESYYPRLAALNRGELHVPAEYANDGTLTESMTVCEIPMRIEEEVKFDFVWDFIPKDYNHPTVEELAMFGYYNPPSEPEIVCPCCKGSGIYTGFLKVEPCGECKGTGKVKGSKPAVDQPGAKGSPDVDYGALGL